jgi:hypothetical protein
MRSPGSRRTGAEQVARAASLLAMIALAWRLWSGVLAPGGVVTASTSALDSALVRWSVVAPSRVELEASVMPGPQQRDWLVALRRTGLGVDWTTADSSGGALVVEVSPESGAPARIAAIGTPGQSLVLRDDLGRIDSSTVGRHGAVSWRATPIGPVTVQLANATASAAVRESLFVRPVLVVGQVGWESRFVVTALEESGWTVSARLTVAPGAVVRQGDAARIDTAYLSAVVVLDSLWPLDSREVTRFVREGGGLVASGAGVRNAALSQLLPRVSSSSAGEVGGLLGPDPRSGLSARTFVSGVAEVPLERRGDGPVVVGHRVGAGRVVVIGFDDTWRLRMIPASESAPEAHRTWWSSLVAGAALARPVARDVGVVDEAPLASTINALGRPLSSPRPSNGGSSWPSTALLAAVATLALLGEWLSRRLRGVA